MKNQIQWILQEKYGGQMTKLAEKDIKRLKSGEPVDYIIGWTQFLGCKIDLSKKPLIPRVETEFWVEKGIEELKQRNPFGMAQGKIFRSLKILDIFSGSGCIGIALAKHLPHSNVVFADKHKNAIGQIKKNCMANRVRSSNYKVIQSDVLKNVIGRFDFIFANPPYIPDYRINPSVQLRTILRNRIQSSVLQYEPKEALFGGMDGLKYIKIFLSQAKDFLLPKGKIFMEFDPPQKKNIERMIKKFGYKSHRFNKDQYGKWRWVVIE